MEACDGSVTLGKMVCAVSEYAEVCIRVWRLSIGASEMASGRRPSMDRINTRRARGAGVAVMVGVRVSVGVAVTVSVAVALGVDVSAGDSEGSGVAVVTPGSVGIWQASRLRSRKTYRKNERGLEIVIGVLNQR
jgi:hypothetical protein